MALPVDIFPPAANGLAPSTILLVSLVKFLKTFHKGPLEKAVIYPNNPYIHFVVAKECIKGF